MTMKNLIWNIRNILRWIPRLWNSYDWDYYFLLHVMRYKLQDMESFFRGPDPVIRESLEVADQIAHAIQLLDAAFDGGDSIEDQNRRYVEFWDYVRDNVRGWWD